jgi:subtilisin family serine protease
VAAIAGNAKIMPIRIADTSGTGYWSMIAQGISYAIDHGARVASISFDNLLSSSSIISAAQYMKSKNGWS